MGGPAIEWSYGRTDSGTVAARSGLLPVPDSGRRGVDRSDAGHLREVFGRMGFDQDWEIVALSGAHSVGRCNVWASGYDGTWTSNSIVFDNSYYMNLLELEWKKRAWDGPVQYSSTSSSSGRPLTMLPTDMALLGDSSFRRYVVLYAQDESVFDRDFSRAFGKLLELGTENLTPCNLWN